MIVEDQLAFIQTLTPRIQMLVSSMLDCASPPGNDEMWRLPISLLDDCSFGAGLNRTHLLMTTFAYLFPANSISIPGPRALPTSALDQTLFIPLTPSAARSTATSPSQFAVDTTPIGVDCH
jgi:hypothetical protein